ncbi:hypothetical protein ACF09L_33550 [Streptomyces sp. NPDC014779]|uniref:hypothetical protein n=1 Tax=Streptomyces sp. NPDC014779 TaxID=3364911 RepID=UPI0036F9978B
MGSGPVGVCDFAHPLAGPPTTVVYLMSVPHGLPGATGRALARLDQVRLCASVSGRYDLHAQVLLHGLAGIDPFEARLERPARGQAARAAPSAVTGVARGARPRTRSR